MLWQEAPSSGDIELQLLATLVDPRYRASRLQIPEPVRINTCCEAVHDSSGCLIKSARSIRKHSVFNTVTLEHVTNCKLTLFYIYLFTLRF